MSDAAGARPPAEPSKWQGCPPEPSKLHGGNSTGGGGPGHDVEGEGTPHVEGEATLIEILLVEDNPGDVRLLTETFREGKIRNRLSVVEDGVEALAFLRREGRYSSAPRPDLILLDLSLPRKNGQEVLAEVKQDADLKRIPVCVITSSAAEKDILEAYNNHVNCYLTKPVDLGQFMGMVRSVEEFWLSVVKLPP